MLLGIDVGGTFTDAVIVDHEKVLAKAKAPTTHGKLLEGILAALDKVLVGINKTEIKRVALSTTIVTNALVEGRTDRVGLLIMPGPGLDIAQYLPVSPYILSGYVDHRGREVVRPSESELDDVCRNLVECSAFAIAGKFSVRNPVQEIKIAEGVRKKVAPSCLTLSSEISGTLNFLRRTNSAYYNSAVWRHFSVFADAVEKALAKRQIIAPVYVLKADGGTMPLAAARHYPVETIFTGPAASVLGIMAMGGTNEAAVSLDIGGTTTDIALWKDGVPLFAAQGASIAGYHTSVRSFWLKSVGLGGDSYVRWENNELKIGPMRKGPAMAVGGQEPTVSDAMIAAGLASFGNHELAQKAMFCIGKTQGWTVQETAEKVLQVASGLICEAIEAMINEHYTAPVYKVDDIIHNEKFVPQAIIGVGGAAEGLVPLAAKYFGVAYSVSPEAMVANAVGAAVAKPTIDITFRADTAQGYYTVAELGLKQALPSRRFNLEDARLLASKHLSERAVIHGIQAENIETVYEEEFNLVRGFSTVGKIMTVRMQIKPGVLAHLVSTAAGKEGLFI